jgi:hypothetical protein
VDGRTSPPVFSADLKSLSSRYPSLDVLALFVGFATIKIDTMSTPQHNASGLARLIRGISVSQVFLLAVAFVRPIY